MSSTRAHDRRGSGHLVTRAGAGERSLGEPHRQAIERLKEEHRAIRTMLAALEAAASRLDAGWEVPPSLFMRAIEFFQDFADGCHHFKEEGALFPALAGRGIGPEMSVVAALLAQHDAGRKLLGDIEASVKRLAAGDDAARATLVADIRTYAALLYEHIRIEDEYFYPLAARALSPADDRVLVDEFDRAERACVRPRERERCARIVADFEALVAVWWKG